MHLTDRDLALLADGELPWPQAAEARRHLAECSACAASLAEREADHEVIGAALAALDHTAPQLDVETVIAAAGTGRAGRRGVTAAVVATLTIAAVAAAAVPGPVHRLVQQLFTRPVAQRVVPQRTGANVAVPAGSVVEIAFRADQRTGQIRLHFRDTTNVSITERGGAGAGYTLTPTGIDVDNTGLDGSYDVVVPARAATVRVLVHGRAVLAKNAGRVHAASATAVGDTLYVIALPVASSDTPR